MDILFRCLVVVAIGLGVVALVGRPDAPDAARSERDPDDARQIASLEQRVRDLESRGVAPAPAPGPEGTAAVVASTDDVPAMTALEAAIDRRLDERLPRFREELVKEYRRDQESRGLEMVAASKPKTLEEIGEEIGLNGNEIDFIRAEREAMQSEIIGIFKDEGETDDAFKSRMQNLAADPEGQAEAQQKMMGKMMSGEGIAKMMSIQAKHDKAIRERIGADRYRKYKSMENGMEGGGSLSLGLHMRADTSDQGR